MNSSDVEVISIFEETKALLKGHFILRSGLRSEHFFNVLKYVSIWKK